jgi:hypothetical protein
MDSMERAEITYQEGAKYRVKEPISDYGAAFLIPGTDEIIPQTGDGNPTPVMVGHASEPLKPGAVVRPRKKEYDNGIRMVTLHRRIKVVEFDINSPASWFNHHIGEEFDVVRFYDGLIPKRYEVDLSEYKERGEVTVDRGYVTFSCAEVVE